jgi:hypothetical protein
MRPRQDSNLRTPLRRRVLYPLSYGGSGRRTQYQPVEEATDVWATSYRHGIHFITDRCRSADRALACML